jgi:hypothetical protein
MSSPISLVIQLRPSDRNRTLSGRFGSINPNGKKYLQIYVHCATDAYSAAAVIQNDKCFTYKEALEYVLDGDRSTVTGNTAYLDPKHDYRPNTGETWEHDQPECLDEPYCFDYGSVLMFTRSDDENESVDVLYKDNDEDEYELAD